jgi:N-acyl homoserine lactone hydrolase
MGAINRVSVISTGSVQIRPQHVESNGTPLMWWLNTSREWTPPRPINVYVIEHESGLVLFDTGQDRRSVTDSKYFPGGLAGHLYRRLARFEIASQQTLTDQLAANGYNIADVSVAVLSHLHQDHIGGLRELPRSARIVVSAAELSEVERPFAALAGLLREHILIPGLNWEPVTPSPLEDASIAPFTEAHDVMGDGSLLLLSTPGHTPGSLSMLLRDEGMPPLLFVGDLTYDVTLLAQGRIPGVGHPSGLHQATNRVNALVAGNPGMPVLAAHDPAAAGLLEVALQQGTVRR